jgi:hypothetical protein
MNVATLSVRVSECEYVHAHVANERLHVSFDFGRLHIWGPVEAVLDTLREAVAKSEAACRGTADVKLTVVSGCDADKGGER